MADETLQRTPLHEEHHRLGAKLIPFAGFEMPVQYLTGIVAEHNAVRGAAGLFDVSHMGELEIRGDRALELVQLVTTNDASRLEPGAAQYTTLCQEDGGALDDCIVFRFEDHYLLVANASNRDRDRDWLRKFAPRFDVEVRDASDETALLALQGPAAERILSRLAEADLPGTPFYHFMRGTVAGRPAVISRTGYTGEDGFEIFVASTDAVHVWRALLEVGGEDGLVPVGLGARDSLRLEMGYILYGNDLDPKHSPLEAGLGWVVKLDKGDFIGGPALQRQKEEGVRQRLAGFVLQDRGFPRRGYEIRFAGEPAGEVASGTFSPSLDRGIGMAYLPVEAARAGTSVEIVIRDRPVPAEVVKRPFYQDGSLRR